MKYRVNQYVVVRVPVDIDADSVKEAVQKADGQFVADDIFRDGEYAESSVGYLVDTYGEGGEILYEEEVNCEWDGKGNLVGFDGEPI